MSDVLQNIPVESKTILAFVNENYQNALGQKNIPILMDCLLPLQQKT